MKLLKRVLGRPGSLTAMVAVLSLALMSGCVSPERPTAPVEPTLDLAGTVTAQAVPLVATQTAISAAATQAAGAQATLAAQTQAQQASAGQTAVAATRAALAQAGLAQSGTATAQAQVAATQAANATALAQAAQALAATASAQPPQGTVPVLATSTVQPPVGTPIVVGPTVPPTLTPGCVPVDPALAAIAAKAAAAGWALGCPRAAASPVKGALQEYWSNAANPDPNSQNRSLMIWRETGPIINVVVGQDAQAGQGTLLGVADTWHEGDPEVAPACATLKPPAGYLMPIRGFGKVWCANNLASVIGWPKRLETTAAVLVQVTGSGLLLKVSAPDQGAGYLVALDLVGLKALTSTVAP